MRKIKCQFFRVPLIVLLSLAAAVTLIYLFLALLPILMALIFQQAAQAKMHCWVRAVDQDGNSVKGYKCRVVEEHAPRLFVFGVGDVIRVFETGDDGTFEYSSKGATGRAFFGYDWGAQWELNPRHLIQRHTLGVHGLELQSAIRKNPSGYLGSKGNPYLLHVFTHGAPRKLLYNKAFIKLQTPGDYFCMDFLSGKTWESELPEGDIAMVDIMYVIPGKDAFGNKIPPAPGTNILAGKRCELASVQDDWALGPPQEGYAQELCWPKSWEARTYSSQPGAWFYYRITRNTSSEALYGVVKALRRVNGGFVEYFTNLQGERNLYFKGYEKRVLPGHDPTIPGCNFRPADFISPPVQ